MFPWDRKSQVLQGGRKGGYRANSINERRDLSYMGGNNSSIAPQSEYLPPINQSHQVSRGRDNSYIGPNSGEYHELQEMPPDGYAPNNGRSLYSRSQSYSPFGGRNERNMHQQKNYARILEDQINSRNAKKYYEKQRNMEIDKRMVEGGEFYKYFGRNHIQDKYYNQALLPSIEATTKNRYLDVRGNTPMDGRLTPVRTDNGYEYVSVNPSGVRFQEENGEVLNDKTRDYLKKIEYKQALEQQILESNLKKKHDSELRMLEDKIDELKGSYVRLKTKPTKDASYEKLQGLPVQGVPVMINGSEVLLKPVDPYKLPSARRPYNNNTKRFVPATDLQLFSDKNNRLRPIIKGAKQSLDFSNDVNASALYPSTIMVDDGMINNYVQVQGELEKIKGDIRDHMTKMNDKLADLRTDLATHSRAAHERDMLQLQVLKDPLLAAGPYEGNSHYLPLPTVEGEMINPDESRHSLMHETQFVPVTDMATGKTYQPVPVITAPDYNPLMDNLSTLTKKIDYSIQNQNQKFERDLASIQQELRLFKKNEEEIQMEKLNEYVNLIGNFVGNTRKLERSLNQQQQKLNREIGTIQDELRAFKANEQQFHMLKYNEYSPLVEDMVTLTKKLERSLNNQQQRLNGELGVIQQELRSLKMKDEQRVFVPTVGYDRLERGDRGSPVSSVAPIDKIDKVEKLIDRIEKIQKTDDKYSLHDNLASVGARYNSAGYTNGGGDMIKGGKVRNRSQNIKHNKRGVKRIRDELPGESQTRV